MTRLHPRHRQMQTKASKVARALPKTANAKKSKHLNVRMTVMDSLATLPLQPPKLAPGLPAISRRRHTMDSLASMVLGTSTKKNVRKKNTPRKNVDISAMLLQLNSTNARYRSAGQKDSITRKELHLPLSRRKKTYPIVRGRQKREKGLQSKPWDIQPEIENNEGGQNSKSPLDGTASTANCDDNEKDMPGNVSRDGQMTTDKAIATEDTDGIDLLSLPDMSLESQSDKIKTDLEHSCMVLGKKSFESNQPEDYYSEIGETPLFRDVSPEDDDEENEKRTLKDNEERNKETKYSSVVVSTQDRQAISPEDHYDSGTVDAFENQAVRSCSKSTFATKIVMVEYLDEDAMYLCLSSGKYFCVVEMDGDSHQC